MKNNKRSFSIASASVFLVLFLIFLSFTASADTIQFIPSSGPYANVTNSDSNINSVIDISNNTVISTTPARCQVTASGQSIDLSAQPSELPVANFSTDTTPADCYLTVHFTDLSENATELRWDFGDGEYSTERNPTHIFYSNVCSSIYPAGYPIGNYWVTLTAINENGTDKKSEEITILANPQLQPFNAYFFIFPDEHDPLSMQFTDASTYPDFAFYKWDFGDGTTSSETNPFHTYPSAGNYTVTLTLTGEWIQDTTSQLVSIVDYKAPVADYSAASVSDAASLKVMFTDKSTGMPTSWHWDFGDGSNSTEQNPMHTYSTAGNYTVNLTVSNGNGKASKSAPITVLPENQNEGIKWGPSIKYDTGSSNSICMDNIGHCIEVHVGSGRLFYKVGKLNFDKNEIEWGPSIEYDTGCSNSISMDNFGHCVEVHVGSGKLFYRVGKVNFDDNTIIWEKDL